MKLNTKQANFINKIIDWNKKMQDLYGEAYNLAESFTEEFATTQDNALDTIEGKTTVDSDSSSGSTDLYVTSTAGFQAGDSIIIGRGTDRQETAEVESIESDYLKLTANLNFTHTSAQADPVQTMGDLYTLGLDYTAIATACNQPMTQFLNFYEGSGVNTREYGKDIRRVGRYGNITSF